MHRIFAYLRGLRRWLIFSYGRGNAYHAYSDDMPIWEGWYEVSDEAIAFRDRDGSLHFIW